jgi:hypothetical protein
MSASNTDIRRRRWLLVLIVAPLVLLVVGVGLYAGHAPRTTPNPTPSAEPTVPIPPVPSVSVPVPESALTAGTLGVAYGSGFESNSPAEQARQLDDMLALRVRWLRIDLPWSAVQFGGPNSWNWSPFDTTVALTTSRGIQPVLILDFTPEWARSKACPKDQRCAPARPADFGRFAAAAAARYARYGAHVYEVWNEQNTANFWLPAADPAAYAQLIKTAYPAIHGADPAAIVLTGGTAPAASGDGDLAPIDFLLGLYRQGAAGYFDALAHHPYCYSIAKDCARLTSSRSAWSQMADTSPSLRSVMIENGDGNKRIWATEFGVPTNGAHSEAEQSRQVTDAFAMFRSYSWAGPLFWYAYRDAGNDPNDNEDHFGLLRPDGTRKPSYAALLAISS